MSKWKSRPIFISSTFRDMQSERDHLHQTVFLELQEKLAKQFEHLEPIDLRWGIDTVSVDDQIKKETLVLKVCLNEIERSIPFIIVLIGDRYGWVPPSEQMKKVLVEAGYKADEELRSVTAMEIEYGLLANKICYENSFFYFRKPLPYDEMPKSVAKEYNDLYQDTKIGRQSYWKLQDLKNKIIKAMPASHVSYYEAHWNGKKVTGLEDWGKKVVEDLWNVLKKEASSIYVDTTNTWEEEEALILSEFLETHSHDFVGRDCLLQELQEYLVKKRIKKVKGIFLAGTEGLGKSSILAKFYQCIENENAIILTHVCGISPKSNSLNFMLKRWIFELTKILQLDNPSSFLQSYSEISEAFQQLLEMASKDRKVFICIDNLDKMDEKVLAMELKWLPNHDIGDISVLVTINNLSSFKFHNDIAFKLIEIQSFSDSKQMIETQLKRYRKTLNEDITQAILEKKPLVGNDLPASNPLWLKLVIDELLFMDADDFEKLEDYEGTDEQKVYQLLLDTVKEISPSILGLYERLLKRTEEVYGYEWTKFVSSLLAVSKNGLREKDLKSLVNQKKNMQWTDLHFAGFRRYLRSHLRQSGVLSQWNFYHAQAVDAINKRYMPKKEDFYKIRGILADYVWKLKEDDPLRRSELGYFLLSANHTGKLAEYYGSLITDEEIQQTTYALITEINQGNEEIIRNLFKEQLTTEQIKMIVRRIKGLLLKEIHLFANKIQTLTICLSVMEKIDADADTIIIVGELYFELGELYYSSNDLEQALHHFSRAVKIFETSTSDSEAKYNTQLMLYDRLIELNSAFKHTDMVKTLHTKKDFIKDWFQRESPLSTKFLLNEIRECRRSIVNLLDAHQMVQAGEMVEHLMEISRKLYFNAPEVANYAYEFSISQLYKGDVEIGKGNYQRAHTLFNDSLSILDRLLTRQPDLETFIRAKALLEERIGNLHFLLGDFDQCYHYFELALTKMKRLNNYKPDSLQYIRDLSLLKERIGVVLQEKGEFVLALDIFQKELFRREELNRKFGGFLDELLVICEKIGDLEMTRNNIREGLDFYKKALSFTKQQKVTSEEIETRIAALRLKISLFK